MRSNTSVDPYAKRRTAGVASREQTRRRLLEAADELFRERGYANTTVTAIAERADVSLQTLYLAWKSKSSLFRAAADAAVTASGTPLSADAWGAAIRSTLVEQVGLDPTAESYLAAVAHLFVEVAARTATYWHMQPGAAAADPDIAQGYEAAMQQRRITMHGVAELIPRKGLRIGTSTETVAEAVWALASPEMFALFTTQGQRTAVEFEKWLSVTLVSILCEPTSQNPAVSQPG